MLPLEFHPNPGGLAFAAAAIALGAWLFSEGLRAARLRSGLGRVRESRLAEAAEGPARVRGRVALESPLFSPLSGVACAGYRLEILGPAGLVTTPIEEIRDFRLVDGACVARVQGGEARLELRAGATRQVLPGEALSEHVEDLLAGSPEAVWLRRTGATLTLTERVLAAGTECHIAGQVSRVRGVTLEAAEEWLRTGTDGAVASGAPRDAFTAEPALVIGPADAIGPLRLSDHATPAADPGPERRKLTGLLAGPLLALGGLLYLAAAAQRLAGWGRG